MKDILETINEAVKHGWSPSQLKKQALKDKPVVKVSTNRELIEEIGLAIKEQGNEADLNYIDVSSLTDFSEIFYYYRDFDGDISEWDMSSARNCTRMFCMSSYTGKNGDISDWNMDKVEWANQMFYKSKFDGDISSWELQSLDPRQATQFMGGAVLAKTRKHWPKKFR